MKKRKERKIPLVGIVMMVTALLLFGCDIDYVRDVMLDRDELILSLPTGERAVLTATVLPEFAAEKTVRWSVEPTGVVTLIDNKNSTCTVIPVADGTATVIATAVGGSGVYGACRVKIASALDNTALVAAVGSQCGWTVETDGTVKLTTENLAAIRKVTQLDISGKSLNDLSGIEWFTGLESLDCSSNTLTEIDISGNGVLTELNCADNQMTFLKILAYPALTSLDVSNNTKMKSLECSRNLKLTALRAAGCTALTSLDCAGNALTSLDVSGCTALTNLYCYNNGLTSLDVTANTKLTGLNCRSNALTTLNVSANTALTGLDCRSNALTALDVSANTALMRLFCGSNRLTSLDVSANTELTDLSCESNALTSLYVSKNTKLSGLWCHSNRLKLLDVTGITGLIQLLCGNQTSDGKNARILLLTLTPAQQTKWKEIWKKTYREENTYVSLNVIG